MSQTQPAFPSGIIRKWNTRDDLNARCIRKQLRGARSNRRMVVLGPETKDGGNVIAAATRLLPRPSWRVKLQAGPVVVVAALPSPQVSTMFSACSSTVESPFIDGFHRSPFLFIHCYTEVCKWHCELKECATEPGSISSARPWMSNSLSAESHTYHRPVRWYLAVEGRWEYGYVIRNSVWSWTNEGKKQNSRCDKCKLKFSESIQILINLAKQWWGIKILRNM